MTEMIPDEFLDSIYLGDCVEFMKMLPDGCIDLTVTSPPYDNLRTYNGFSFDFEGVARNLYRITKDGGIVVWVVGDATINGSETGSSFRQALYFKECGFRLHDTMIYEKAGITFPENNRYYPTFEYMFILSKGKPQKVHLICDRENQHYGRMNNQTERQPDGSQRESHGHRFGKTSNKYGIRFNIWRYSIGKGNSAKEDYAFDHPAIFPEKLAEDHIISWSDENDIVFDPFMGSGTTAKMAILNGRHFTGSELSEEYYDICMKRISDAYKEKKTYFREEVNQVYGPRHMTIYDYM